MANQEKQFDGRPIILNEIETIKLSGMDGVLKEDIKILMIYGDQNTGWGLIQEKSEQRYLQN